MLIAGATFAAAQWAAIVVGAMVPVLAWRLAADVAAERGLSLERSRTLALGTGLTTAVYLPLVLHSALPDSTMPFTALALAACLLITRIARDPAIDRRLLGLGVLVGLAALTRNEALWIGLAWAVVAWRIPNLDRATRARLIGVVAVVAGLVFLPWAVRDWIVFGSPLPGQAAANALSVTGSDIFAWNDPPTLARYLAVGPGRLVQMRIDGFIHNLVSVLLLPGVPIAVIGLLALPWQARDRALRPLVLVSAVTFTVTTLLFPVSTTWGTFLHAAGPVQVLLVIAALLALDAGIARLGAWRGWTRPVAWLGALLGDLRLGTPLGRPAADVRRRVPPDRGALRRRSGSGWPRSVIRLTPRPARSSRTSRSGWPRPNASRRSPSRTRRRPTSWTWPRPFRGHTSWSSAVASAAGRQSSMAAGTTTASTSWTWVPARPARRTRLPALAPSRSSARESRPVYSEADGACTRRSG